MSKEEQIKSSNFNLQTLNPQELEEHLQALFSIKKTVFILGQRGSGKTVITKSTINKVGSKEVYLNLSMLERVDLAGYPQILGNTGKYVDFLLPKYFQHLIEGDQPCVLVLDEVDKCDPSLNAPLLELTQFHSINGMKLKNLHGIVMTANFVEEGGNKPISPLLDRSVKYILKNDVDSWLQWAGTHGIHPSISTFIKEHPSLLQGKLDDADYASASPRAWEAASDLVHYGINNSIQDETVFKMVCGQVGSKISAQYKMYYMHYLKLIPTLDNLFDGEKEWMHKFKNFSKTEELMFIFSVVTRFVRLYSANLEAFSDNKKPVEELEKVEKFLSNLFIEFLDKHCERENAMLALRTQASTEFKHELINPQKRKSSSTKKIKDFLLKMYKENNFA